MKSSAVLLLVAVLAAAVSSCTGICPSSHDASMSVKLDGKWSFRLLANENESPGDVFWREDFDVSQWDLTDVPSCWEMKGYGKPLYDEKISGESGLYRRSFALPESWPAGNLVRLRFEGVMFGAKVWVNGREAGSFTSSFNANELDITKLVRRGGENLLCVRTHSHPKGAEFDTNDDWTLHGIFRSVVLESLPPLHVESFALSTRLDGDDALVSVRTELSGEGGVKVRLFSPDGREVASGCGGRSELRVARAKLWSADTPDLYELELTVADPGGKTVQVRREKVGLKEVSWNGGVLRVNGKSVKLRGVNHHDITPTSGRAVTDREQWRDVELIKKANCNFIRTSHYPPSKALLDACDRLGVYVMDEIPFGLGNRFLDDRSYGPILLERARLTLARDMNRASVIAWSVGNENHVTPITLEAARLVKKLDPSRPWCFPMQPREFAKTISERPLHELGDMLNWHYPAICGDAAKLKEYFRKFDRPYLSGEYAHAYGLDFGLLEWYWDDMMWNDPSYAGGAVWMFHDQGILRKAGDMTADERRNCVWPDKDHVWDSARDLGTDGVVYSDRTPQSDYFEMRKVYAPVRLGAADVKFAPGGRLRFSAPLENRFDSVALDEGAKGRWRLFADRREVSGGELELPSLQPHAKGVLSLEAGSPEADASVWRLEISFDSPRTGYRLYERSYPLKVELPRAEAAGDIALGFDGATREIVVRSAGAEIFRSPLLARVDRRGMLSKDRKTNQYDRWTPNALEPSAVEVVSQCASALTLDALWKPKGHASKKDVKGRRELAGRISFKVESGRIRVDYALRYACDRKLVETGIALELPAKFRRFDWVGLGPYECYPRASMLSEFGVWAYDRDDLRFAGNRREVRMVLSSAADGSVFSLECPGNGADVAFERRGDRTLVAHNAFVAGKACKFNDPLEMADVRAGEELKGSFVFAPQARTADAAFESVFGSLREIAPFKPFFKSYD